MDAAVRGRAGGCALRPAAFERGRGRRDQATSRAPAPCDPERGLPAGAAAGFRQAPLPASVLPAFLMAAGLGTRLRPLTERFAKPLLPIDGRPVLARSCASWPPPAAHGSRSSSAISPSRFNASSAMAAPSASRPLRPPAAPARLRGRAPPAGEEPPYLVLAADTVFPAGAIARLRTVGAGSWRDRHPAPTRTAADRVFGRAVQRLLDPAAEPVPPHPSGPWARSCTSDAVRTRPFELGTAFQPAIDAGEQSAGIDFGRPAT